MTRGVAVVLPRLATILCRSSGAPRVFSHGILESGDQLYLSETSKNTRRSYAEGSGRVTGLNILKQGQDPEEMKDEDVPEWLARLGKVGNGTSLLEMERKLKECGIDGMTLDELKYLKKLQNRKQIKHSNALRAK